MAPSAIGGKGMEDRTCVEGPIRGLVIIRVGRRGGLDQTGAGEGDSVKPWRLLVTEVRERMSGGFRSSDFWSEQPSVCGSASYEKQNRMRGLITDRGEEQNLVPHIVIFLFLFYCGKTYVP